MLIRTEAKHRTSATVYRYDVCLTAGKRGDVLPIALHRRARRAIVTATTLPKRRCPTCGQATELGWAQTAEADTTWHGTRVRLPFALPEPACITVKVVMGGRVLWSQAAGRRRVKREEATRNA